MLQNTRGRLLGFKQLKTEKGISYCRMHIDRLEKAGRFPKRVHVGENRVAWIEAEIDGWVDGLVARRDAATKAA